MSNTPTEKLFSKQLVPFYVAPTAVFLAASVALPHTFVVQATAAVIAAAAFGVGRMIGSETDRKMAQKNVDLIKDYGDSQQKQWASEREQEWAANRTSRAPWMAATLAVTAIPAVVVSGVLLAPIGLCVAGAIAYNMIDKNQIKEEKDQYMQVQSLAQSIQKRRSQPQTASIAPKI